MKRKDNSIMLVGGGTGGHAGPILAIYQNLVKRIPDIEIHVVGVGSGEEKYFFSKLPHYHQIKSGKLHRYFTIKNLSEAVKYAIGIVESFIMIKTIRPKLIFSKGGYTSLPVITAANLLKVPYFLHESDIEMGRTNKIMSRNAKKVFVCFPTEYYSDIDKDKLVWSGPILREDDSTGKSHKSFFGFENEKPIIFLTGGSQGSLALTKALLDIAHKLFPKYNIIHQAGKHSIEVAQKFRDSLDESERKSYHLAEFLDPSGKVDMMWEAIKVADLVITRAGSTIAEIAILGKPMILVPWKYAAQNHQLKNAKYLVENNAAVMIDEKDFTSEKLLQSIIATLTNKPDHTNSHKVIFPTDGAEKICDNIIKEIEDK